MDIKEQKATISSGMELRRAFQMLIVLLGDGSF